MNEEPLGALILPEEQMALETLADGILADINARLNRLIRRWKNRVSTSSQKI